MSVPGIRDRIVAHRRDRIAREGHALGVRLPAAREAPLVPFLRDPPLICEIKRKSPSRGEIDASLDPVALARTYAARGVQSVSVLTEEDHFAGSLSDLIAVKRAHPNLAVLRKDFLVDEEDIRVSHAAGADAVLLIASVLTEDELARLHWLATDLGMAALVELHEPEDFEKARTFGPGLVGINARDLTTFHVDLLTPIRLRDRIDWDHQCVFESGVFTQEDALLVSTSGFDGLLVGEATVRDQGAIAGILRGLAGEPPGRATALPEPEAHDRSRAWDWKAGDDPRPGFWSRLAARLEAASASRRPLAKICGITNRTDAELAVELGADLLGFVFADSPRRASAATVRELADLDVLKVAVVVTGGSHGGLAEEVRELLAEGVLDAVQFHGDEEPDECATRAFPYYKALRLGDPEAATQVKRHRSPRVLVDARDSAAYGGTGTRVSPEVVAAVREQGPLWLAGGLSDENIAEVMERFEPELVDVSSGLEAEPGRKDQERMRRFFRALCGDPSAYMPTGDRPAPQQKRGER